MRTSNFALRLQPTIMAEAKALAAAEGVALNQLINVALAEKLAIARTRQFFERYTRGADPARALEILARAGRDNPPMPGDELPEGWKGLDAEAPASKAASAAASAAKPRATRRRTTRSK
jgi:hypothetical protein